MDLKRFLYYQMEALIGIRGSDFVLLAADRRAARSIVVMKATEDKFRELGKTLAVAYSGESGDAVKFAEFLQGNIKLYEMRNEVPLSPSAAAQFTRRQVADSLRSRSPYQVNMLLGGCIPSDQPRAPSEGEDLVERPGLYWIDYLGTLTELPFAAHGYASYFVLSLMDRHYRPDMTLEEGLGLLKMCLAELKTRFIVNLPDFSVKIVRPTGIETMVMVV